MKRGTLYGIGVGPGDPELLTIKALRCIRESDIIILPAQPKEECYAYLSVRRIYEGIDQKEILCMPFPMIKDRAALEKSHRNIYEKISNLLAEGKTISFLTIGDPCVYSTYSYIHRQELAHHGNPVIISGVPSFCAAAAAAGISLADNKEQIHIIPGSYDVEGTLSLPGTKVYMKSGKQLGKLREMLLKSQEESQTEVYCISDCTMPEERIIIGVENMKEESGYLTIVIVKERK